jgi:hypothetical protein
MTAICSNAPNRRQLDPFHETKGSIDMYAATPAVTTEQKSNTA